MAIKTYARVEDGVVVQVIEQDNDTHPVDSVYIECDSSVGTGDSYDGTTFTTKTYSAEEIRELRDARLKETDWTQMPDSPLSDSEKTAWATYRQGLRDMMDGYTPTATPTFPTK